MSIYCVGLCLKTITSLSLAEKFILLALCEKADNDGRNAYPSVSTLARYAECSERSVQRHLRSLERQGWIAVREKATPRRPTNYSVAVLKFQGCQTVTPEVTPVTGRGDIAVAPDPSSTRPTSTQVNNLDVHTFVVFWITLYAEKRLGATYEINKSREIPMIKRLLKSYGLERLKQMAELLLVTDEVFISSTDRGLSILNAKKRWLDHLLRQHGR
jgi:DNA-binding MarR family transcriptional regulator